MNTVFILGSHMPLLPSKKLNTFTPSVIIRLPLSQKTKYFYFLIGEMGTINIHEDEKSLSSLSMVSDSQAYVSDVGQPINMCFYAKQQEDKNKYRPVVHEHEQVDIKFLNSWLHHLKELREYSGRNRRNSKSVSFLDVY